MDFELTIFEDGQTLPPTSAPTLPAAEENLNEPSKAYKFSVFLLKQKRYEEAEKVLRELLRSENCFEVLEALSICLYNLGHWSECAHIARQALMLGEGFRDQRFQLLKFLGNSLIQIRDYEGAREAYEKAFLIYPGSDVLQVNFGTLSIQENDWNQAIECYRQALFLNCDNDQAWVGVGLCHRMRGDLELAFANIERALDQNRLNETALSLLLEWTRDQSEFRRAAPRFTSFVDAGGFNATVSELFIRKATYFGSTALAAWEQFHLRLRTGEGNA